MKSIIRFVVGLLAPAILLSACVSDFTLDIYGSISGKVTDYSTGKPIAVAQVTLVEDVKTIQTGSDGTFSFSDLEEGKYTISVQKEGYRPELKYPTVVSGETTEVVIALIEITK